MESMKRTFLLTAAILLLVLLFCGCESDKGGTTHTNPPRVTANVTSSPAPASPTPTVKPSMTPSQAPTASPGMGGTTTPDTGTPVPGTGTPVPSEAPQPRLGLQPGGRM